MKKKFLPLALLANFFVSAQDFSLFQKKEYQNDAGDILPYRLLFPLNYDASKKYPVVLFLHGVGERGNDNEKQLTHGAKFFLTDSNRANFPCFVIFPQCPPDRFWSVEFGLDKLPLALSFDYSSSIISWPLQSSIAVVQKMVAEGKADISHIYVSGLSMGGMGTFEAVYRFPGLFAAAMPICGGGDTLHYDRRVSETAFWVFHGDADRVVPVSNSRQMVDQLKKIKAEVKYTEYPGVDHNSWDNAFAEPGYLRWLFSHKRKNAKF